MAPHSFINCDRCHQTASAGMLLHGCRRCNYDLCERCHQASKDGCPRSLHISQLGGDGSRQSRLAAHSRRLFHQTSESNARSILDSKQMRRGSDGLVGGGIYFAESREETEAKAHEHGVILRAVVLLGRVKEIQREDRSITFASLQNEGFDSVKVSGRPTGIEWVVYNWDQVQDIERVEKR